MEVIWNLGLKKGPRSVPVRIAALKGASKSSYCPCILERESRRVEISTAYSGPERRGEGGGRGVSVW
jgi:hypothetical protein